MKAQLTFDLDDEMDEHRYNQCVKAQDMAFALSQIACNMRKKVEWEAESRTDNPDPLDIVFEHIAEILEDNWIDIDRLTR